MIDREHSDTGSDAAAAPVQGKHTLADLLRVMAALRTPGSGCPWDLEQTFRTIAPYTIEEAYEVADAIERADMADLEEELGDLLLQVVYHSRMAEEAGAFDFADVADAVTRKMIRRHPHVFGTPEERAAGAQPGFWSRIKAAEQAEKAALRAKLAAASAASASPPTDAARPETAATADDAAAAVGSAAHQSTAAFASLLDDVPRAMPALMRAVKLQDKAAKVGFDWPSLAPVFDKMREELAELEEAALPLDPRGVCAPANADRSESSLDPDSSSDGTDPAEADLRGSVFPQGQRRDDGPANHVGGRTAATSLDASSPSSAVLHATLPQGDREAVSPSPREDFGAPQTDRARIEEEFGDLLFVMANVARHLRIDPEAALRAANQKFTRRFHHIEHRLAAAGSSPSQSTLTQMDALWDEAKALEK